MLAFVIMPWVMKEGRGFEQMFRGQASLDDEK